MRRRAGAAIALCGALIASTVGAVAARALEDPTGDAASLPAIGRLVQAVCAKHEQTASHDVVLKHLARVARQRTDAKGVPNRVRRALDEPWSGQALAGELRDLLQAPFAKPKEAKLEPLVGGVADWLDVTTSDDEPDAKFVELNAQLETAWTAVMDPAAVEGELLKRLSALMGSAHRLAELGLADLETEERARLFASHGKALEAWMHYNVPNAQVPEQEQQDLGIELELLLRVDRRPLFAVARVLARLGEPAFLDAFGPRLARMKKEKQAVAIAGVTGDVVAVVGESVTDLVVLGGKAKTSYDAPLALVLDLGGDDVYARAAVVDDAGLLVSAVVDLQGNDTYANCASAIGGVALLADRGGNDTYKSGRFAQGAAGGGVALLLDLQGNDTYSMEDYGQGFGFQGTGLLLDGDGNDVHDAWAFAQGSTLATGFGALVDGKGDDTYLADLHWPDSYGDSGPNVYHGASQGSAIGVRPATPGGFAALVDLGAGKDRYQAGNFSQGGAYYFSFTLMYDGGGDDENFGTRYSQGYGVHQAVGVRWDAGGNDTYHTRCAANLGASWDEGIGWFFEDGGNDLYDEQGGISVGGASNSGLAVFIDGGGDDTYKSGTGKDTQGGNGDASYYNEPSLGVFVDLGGGKDSYSRADRKDGDRLVDAGVGVFLDVKEKTIAEVLSKP